MFLYKSLFIDVIFFLKYWVYLMAYNNICFNDLTVYKVICWSLFTGILFCFFYSFFCDVRLLFSLRFVQATNKLFDHMTCLPRDFESLVWCRNIISWTWTWTWTEVLDTCLSIPGSQNEENWKKVARYRGKNGETELTLKSTESNSGEGNNGRQ